MTVVYYCYLERHGSIKETKVTVGQTLKLLQRNWKGLSKLREAELPIFSSRYVKQDNQAAWAIR